MNRQVIAHRPLSAPPGGHDDRFDPSESRCSPGLHAGTGRCRWVVLSSAWSRSRRRRAALLDTDLDAEQRPRGQAAIAAQICVYTKSDSQRRNARRHVLKGRPTQRIHDRLSSRRSSPELTATSSPARRQARRGHCPAQLLAPPAARRIDGREKRRRNILLDIGPQASARRRYRAASPPAPFNADRSNEIHHARLCGRDVIRSPCDLCNRHRPRGDAKRKEVEARAQTSTPENASSMFQGAGASSATRESFRRKLGPANSTMARSKSRAPHRHPCRPRDLGMPGSQVGMINLSDMLGKASAAHCRAPSRSRSRSTSSWPRSPTSSSTTT